MDGRTANGCKYWIKVYNGKDETKAEAGRLKARYDLCLLAQNLQRTRLFDKTDTEIEDILKAILPACPDGLRPETNQNLLGLAVRHARQNKDNDLVLKLTDPFIATKWDPFHPTLGSLPSIKMCDKIAQFERIFVKECLVPMIHSGQDMIPEVLRLSRKVRADHMHEQLDILTFDRPTIASLNMTNALWEYNMMLLDANCSVGYMALQTYNK